MAPEYRNEGKRRENEFDPAGRAKARRLRWDFPLVEKRTKR